MAATVIRDARPEDMDETISVMLAAYREYAPAGSAEAWQRYSKDVADVRSRLPFSQLVVAEQGGRIVGAVTFFPEGSRSEAEGWPRGWAGLRLLAVRPDHRGRGIGRMLTEECIRRARRSGVRTLGLHTTTLMRVAQGMYERMGFARAPEYDFRIEPDILVLAYRLDLPARA